MTKKKRQHAHAKPTPSKTKRKLFRKRGHKHKYRADPGVTVFTEGGETKYTVIYRCYGRGKCPKPTYAEIHPQRSGKPWWRR